MDWTRVHLSDQYAESSVGGCWKKFDPKNIFNDNTQDIASTLTEILVLGGIHRCKATSAGEAILKACSHYDTRRHGDCNEGNPTSLNSKFVIMDLENKCLMTHVEALFTCLIIRQLIKAFFQNVPQCGIRNYIIEAKYDSNQKKLWNHAARRTVAIFEAFQGAQRATTNNIRTQIKVIFQNLLKRIEKRRHALEVREDSFDDPEITIERFITKSYRLGFYKDTLSPDIWKPRSELSSTALPEPCDPPCCEKSCEDIRKLNLPTSKGEHIERPIPIQGPDNTTYEKFKMCTVCKSPKQMCACNIDPVTGKLCLNHSQGPFRCDWYRTNKERRVKSEYHVCPIDCWDCSSVLMDSEYASDDCSSNEGESENVDSGFSEFTEKKIEKVCEEETDTSSEECEPFMEGSQYLCKPAACDLKPIMLADKVLCIPQLIEKKRKKVRRLCCRCVKKRRASHSKKPNGFGHGLEIIPFDAVDSSGKQNQASVVEENEEDDDPHKITEQQLSNLKGRQSGIGLNKDGSGGNQGDPSTRRSGRYRRVDKKSLRSSQGEGQTGRRISRLGYDTDSSSGKRKKKFRSMKKDANGKCSGRGRGRGKEKGKSESASFDFALERTDECSNWNNAFNCKQAPILMNRIVKAPKLC